MQPTPLPPHRPGSGNPGRAPCGSSKKLAMQRKGLHRANSRRPHTRPSEVHAGCSDDSPIALRLIAPMRLYSRRSDRTVIGRGGSRCSAHEDGSEGGGPGIHIEIHDVVAAFSKRGSRSKWFKARHRENPEGRGRGCSASPPPTKVLAWQKQVASPDSLNLGRVSHLSNQLLLMALVPPR